MGADTVDTSDEKTAGGVDVVGRFQETAGTAYESIECGEGCGLHVKELDIFDISIYLIYLRIYL